MMETTRLPVSIRRGDIVYRDRNQVIQHVKAEFDGFTKEYFVSDHGKRAAIVVVNKGEILLVRQYRLLLNGISCEIPGGKIEENEAPEAAAARECLEETGIKCASLKPLLDFMPSLDIWNNPTNIFYTEKTQEMDNQLADRRVWVPLDRCIEMIFKNQISDSLSIIGIMAYQIMLSQRVKR